MEFALVFPILLLVAVAIADFGRIFATGIILDNAARDAAEVGASRYLANPPGPLDAPAPTGDSTFYAPLHRAISRAVCAESRELPNSAFDVASTDCPGMPLIQVCIHDAQDTSCGLEAHGSTIPAGCDRLSPAPTNAQGHGVERYVEVRTCYHFTPILGLPLPPLDDFWVQRVRTFGIPCYFVLGAGDCG